MKESRMDFLFRQIAEGSSAEDAYKNLTAHQIAKSMDKREEKGNLSELAIVYALSSLPNVSSIERSERYSPEDMSGIDMIVLVDDILVPFVAVQSKSSETGIREFMMKRKPNSANHPLIILNGTEPHEVIQDDFSIQFERIKSFVAGREAA